MKKNIVIIILTIIILCLGGYLVYDKLLSNDNNEEVVGENNQNNDESNQSRSYDLALAEELLEKYYFGFSLTGGRPVFDAGYTDASMRYLAIRNLEADNSIDCNNLYTKNGNTYRVQLDDGSSGDCTGKSISYERVSNEYKKLFGDSKVLEKKDISYYDSAYHYNNETNSFIILSRGLGGIMGVVNEYKVKNANTIGDKLVLEVVSIDFTRGYNDYIIAKLNDRDITVQKDFYSPENLQKTFDENIENAKTYIFTFFEENGIYKLENMVKKHDL